MDILIRNKKDGNAISRGQALLHMIAWKFIIHKHTIKAAIEDIPPKKINTWNIWKQLLSRLVTRINAIQYKTERQRIRQEAKTERFSLRNTNKKIKIEFIRENRGRNKKYNGTTP